MLQNIIIILICFILLRMILNEIYKRRITPTMRFILAAGANTSFYFFKTCIDIKGYKYSLLARKFARYLLRGGWGVEDKEDTIYMIEDLLNQQQNKELMKDLKYFIKKDYLKYRAEDSEKYLEMLRKVAERYPTQGILAWDLCRVLYVAGSAYICGYIKYKEAIRYCVQACRILQANYSSWDDMMESCFLGHYYWSENNEVNDSRRKLYEKLKRKPNGLYSIPWNTVLDENDVIKARFL